jgi:hypothetical protein
MTRKHLGRNGGDDMYYIECDIEGCGNSVEYAINDTQDVLEEWKTAKMKKGGIIQETRHICPKH